MKKMTCFIISIMLSCPVSAWHVLDKGKAKNAPLLLEEGIKEVKKQEKQQAVLEVIDTSEFMSVESVPSNKSKIKKKGPEVAANHIDPTTVNTAVPKGFNHSNVFEKKTAVLTEEENAVNNYSQALELLSLGKESKAMLLLEAALEAFPRHMATRLELARIYIKNQQDLEAKMILEEGLNFSEHPELLKLLAVVFERKNQSDKALACLNRIPIERKSDKNTVAFLGQIYQRVGQYQQAKNQYDLLLQVEPLNPLWLLGKSIALDSQGKTEDALEGYHRLQADCTLEPHLLNYVKERVTELKG